MLQIILLVVFFFPKTVLCDPDTRAAPLLNLFRKAPLVQPEPQSFWYDYKGLWVPPTRPEPQLFWQDVTTPKVAIAAIGVTLGSFALYKTVSYLSTTPAIKSCLGGLKSIWFKVSHLYYGGPFQATALKKPVTMAILLDNRVSNAELKYSLHGLREDLLATRGRMAELKASLNNVLTEEIFSDATVNVQDIVEKLTASGFLTTVRHKSLSRYPIDADILSIHRFTPEQLLDVKQILEGLVVEHAHIVENSVLVPYLKEALRDTASTQVSLDTCLTSLEEVLRICAN